jgi:PAS domain S-box-containing protein
MALRESQEKLQTIFQASPAAIGHFDMDGFITFANDSMGLLFNIECLELEGTHYLDLVHPENILKVMI